jgi:hypothetical protein
MVDDLNDNDPYGWEGTTQENMVKYIETVRSYDDDEKFKTFRSNLHSTGILEGDLNLGHDFFTRYNAVKSLYDLKTDFIKIIKDNPQLKEIDKVGGPKMINYNSKITGGLDIGEFSPFTLKYIWNACLLMEHHGQFPNGTIVEVGGGYGGLCVALDKLVNFEKYILIDLPDVINLAKRFLKHFPKTYKKVTFLTTKDIKNILLTDIDFFIADASLAECNIDVQKIYFDRLVKNSKKGWINYNTTHKNMTFFLLFYSYLRNTFRFIKHDQRWGCDELYFEKC